MNDNYLEQIHGHSILILSFSGYAKAIGGIVFFEFMNFLNKHFPETDKIFLKDTYGSSYHRGVGGISTDVDTTVEFLKTKMYKNVYDVSGVCYTKPIYTKVLFLGNSGGGYASLLFSSLLNVTTALAFVPQTILRKPDKDQRYNDLKPLINPTTKYYLYADTSVKYHLDPHHISHCERIGDFPNVTIKLLPKVDLKQLRDSGELFKIIYDILKDI